MKNLKLLAGLLVVIGALNWGLVAVGEFDLVAAVFGLDFGETNAASRAVYGLVGLSGVLLALDAVANRRTVSQPSASRSSAVGA